MSLGYVVSTNRAQRRVAPADATVRRLQASRHSVMALLALSVVFHAGCATQSSAPPQEAPAGTAHTGVDTPPHMDPKHLAHVGQRYYPTDSMALGEEGICRMAVTVEPNGRVSERHLVRSSGLPRLDEACINAFPADVRFIPATRGGKPIQKTVIIPIVWCFGENCRDRAEALSLQRLR